jgi:hypothetical protein
MIEYLTEFTIGDIAYVKTKAAHGKLEAIAIRDIIIPPTSDEDPYMIYLDTFNTVWNANELTTKETAESMATQFLNRQLSAISD